MSESLVDWEYWLNNWPDHPMAVTRANAADGYPRPLTPLSQDLVLTYEEAGVRRFYFETLGVLTPADAPDPYMHAFYGLVYLNADQLAGLGEATPGSSRQAMYQQFFGLEADPAYVPPKPTAKARLARGGHRPEGARPARCAWPGASAAEVERQRRGDRRRPARRPRGPCPSASWPPGSTGSTVCRSTAGSRLMTGAGLASGFFEAVRKMLAAWAGDTTGDLCNRLHVALGGNESAEAGRAVRQLAEIVRREKAPKPRWRATTPSATCAGPSPVAAAALDDLIDRFGHRAPAELELSNPSWRMDRRPVLDTVRLELATGGHGRATPGRASGPAEAELAGRVAKVKLPVVRAALQEVAGDDGQPGERQDAGRAAVGRAAPPPGRRRPAARRSGASCPTGDAIHYLRHPELRAVLPGRLRPGAEEIERRREAHRRCLALDLPELVEVGPGWIRPLDDAFIRARGMLPPEKLAADVTRLHGIAAAPGRGDRHRPGAVRPLRRVRGRRRPLRPHRRPGLGAGPGLRRRRRPRHRRRAVPRRGGGPGARRPLRGQREGRHRAGGERHHRHRRRLGRRGAAQLVETEQLPRAGRSGP